MYIHGASTKMHMDEPFNMAWDDPSVFEATGVTAQMRPDSQQAQDVDSYTTL